MEEGLFLRRIREEFPDITWTSHRYLTHGWDHAALILDDALVFRAPKAPAYRGALAQEARLLRHLLPRVKVGIPDYTYKSADGSFAGYPFLAGRELDVGAFHHLSGTERSHVADQLAAFLTALHETPKSVARAYGVSEQEPEKDSADLVRDIEALVLPRLSPPEVRRGYQSQLAEILERFPRDKWSAMSLEDYALGQPGVEDTYCYWLEYKSQLVGSIRGGSARKLIIYKRRDREGWYFPTVFSDEGEAWGRLRSEFVEAFGLAERGDWERTYEDFIEGFRPDASGAGGLSLALEDGVFKRVCRAAQANPGRPYLLLIDEINRGNVAKIMGELLTLLERDKRGLSVTLPQSKETFSVPPNVFLLGTMNTADRSIKLLDAALRRRFAFIECMPDTELLHGAAVGELALDDFLDGLNQRIARFEGREKQVGHSYLLVDGQPVDEVDEFAARFREEILPLL